MATYYGTNGDDSRSYWLTGNNTVDLLAGNDTGYFSGFSNYNINLGSGRDKATLWSTGHTNIDAGSGLDQIYVRGQGTVDANGGSGNDYFYIYEHGDHDINGGAHYDWLNYYYSDDAVRVEFTGTGQGRIYAADSGTGAVDWSERLDFTSVEHIAGSKFDDEAYGSFGDDRFYGGEGDDLFEAGTATQNRGDDYVSGGDGNDTIRFAAGDDQAHGGNGNDRIEGEGGNDNFSGGNGVDRLYGGTGDDTLTGGNEMDFLYGGDGADTLNGDFGHDYLNGGEGADIVRAGVGYDTVIAGNDDGGGNFYDGGTDGYGSKDTLNYASLNQGVFIDVVPGKANSRVGAANEFSDDFTGFETYIGTSHDDIFAGTNNDAYEKFIGGQGENYYIATTGEDTYQGLTTSYDIVDYMVADASRSEINLISGKAELWADGSWGDADWTQTLTNINEVRGTGGNDTMVGSHRDEKFYMREGYSNMLGNGGEDTFSFYGSEKDDAFIYMHIQDFERGEDKVEVDFIHHRDHGWEIRQFNWIDDNNDGWLTDADASFIVSGNNGYLQFDEGGITFEGVTALHESDFIFA